MKVFLFLIAINIPFTPFSQITKKNWMVGGSASFSYTDNKSSSYLNYKSNMLSISPNLGYFFIDRFAAGAKIAISTSKANYPPTQVLQSYSARNTLYSFGPFLRYYFLSSEKDYNILIEGVLLQQIRRSRTANVTSKESASSYGISVGPVVYFNSCVGLEFTVGFSSLKYKDFDGRNNSLTTSIGFQIHLEKEK